MKTWHLTSINMPQEHRIARPITEDDLAMVECLELPVELRRASGAAVRVPQQVLDALEAMASFAGVQHQTVQVEDTGIEERCHDHLPQPQSRHS